MALKIEHVSYHDAVGGAARASYRIHQSLMGIGVNSILRVIRKTLDDPSIVCETSKFRKKVSGARAIFGQWVRTGFHTDNLNPHSVSVLPSGLQRKLNASDANLIHLHWVNGEMISVSEIGKIEKPLVWTLHDMWAFCGAEHVTDDGIGARFVEGYTKHNRSENESGWDLNRWVWSRKCRAWKRPMTIVAPSNWLAECVHRSELLKHQNVVVIPNPIDIGTWRPLPKSDARHTLGLPLDKKLILFGAAGGGSSLNKGLDLLVEALIHLKQRDMVGAHLVIFGEAMPEKKIEIGFPVTYLGYLDDDVSLTNAYSAADVMVVPSRKESFGQTASEAQACATPVVCFRTSGLIDIVDHQQTGYVAEPFNPRGLCDGIQWVLEDEVRGRTLGENGRKKAELTFSSAIVAQSYLNLYEEVLSK